jgi:glycerate 2-kinase
VQVLVAPDKFAGTLTAAEAAEAIRRGWSRRRPQDDMLLAPMSDGGPGFVDALHAALGGDLHALIVTGPLGRPTPAALLLVRQPPTAGDGAAREAPSPVTTAYVESAQACGLALLPRDATGAGPRGDVAEAASTLGVGELVVAALDAGADEVVVGLGGSGTNDGGAGMLAALGAAGAPAGALTGGAASLATVTDVDLGPVRARLAGRRLVAATDVTNPLLGLRGATNVYGPQKGLSSERLFAADGALSRFAHLVDRATADAPGAGAAGGLGYAMLLLGAVQRPGIDVVAQASGFGARLAHADLVLTGEGKLDPQTFTGKVVAGVARLAAGAGVPCVALAGRLEVGSRELRAAGVDGAYGMVDAFGERRALDDPAEALADLADRVARTWGR